MDELNVISNPFLDLYDDWNEDFMFSWLLSEILKDMDEEDDDLEEVFHVEF